MHVAAFKSSTSPAAPPERTAYIKAMAMQHKVVDLPAEIWIQIFYLATDEDIIIQHGLPTVLAESAWYKDRDDEWELRSPQDAMEMLQRRSYAMKKVNLSLPRARLVCLYIHWSIDNRFYL